ncbi:hypothetical protein [Lachnospira multipara]|uniref:hypothetical protein n=1 Tax=Lachnospira multipara TaxID=28051 RepID=UPI000483187A|nr:hypothetical protein [Lachnospira multipara]
MEKKGKGVFWKIYLAIVIIVIMCIIAVWGVLWEYLTVYEKSRPESLVQEYVDELNKSDIKNIKKYISVDLTEFETEQNFETVFKNELVGEWSYNKKIGDGSADEPAYYLLKDGKKKGVIRLSKKDKKAAFNMPIYEVASIEGIVDEARTVTIKAPGNATVSVNNIELGDTYVTSNDEAVVDLEYVEDYVEMPTYKTYTLNGIYGNLNVKVVAGVTKEELKAENVVTENDKTVMYEYSFDCSNEFITSVEERVKSYIHEYIDYVLRTQKVDTITSYVLSGSNARKLYANAAAAISWNGTPKSLDYGEAIISNYQQYTEDCFSVEVNVTPKCTTNSGEVREYPTHMKLIWIKKNDVWYVVDFKLLNK